MLDRKLLRDVARIWGQAVTIALVAACGIAVFVAAISTYGSLRDAQRDYYAASRFADVFASLKRAPSALAVRLAEVPGAAQIETRLAFDVTIDLPTVAEPLSGRIISLPDDGESRLNRLYLRAGRRPDPDSPGEVVASEGFAAANSLRPGDTIETILNGKKQPLRVVGIALSPEYVYASPAGMPIPDDKRFGVLWMGRRALASAFDMEGAFNDVALSLAPGAGPTEVAASLDRLLEPYGGLIAYGRYHQPSDRFVSDEIEQQRVMATTVPVIFLSVAAFLVNIVIGRTVQVQRPQIAALKALGYGNPAIAAHYLKFASILVLGGSVLGIVLGIVTGRLMMESYTGFFRFPVFTLKVSPWIAVLAVAVSLISALVGALAALRSVVRLAPAEAMRPPAPIVYRRTFSGGLPWLRRLPIKALIVLRGLTGRPGRAAMVTLGVALSASMIVLSVFWRDAIDYMVDVQFAVADREDALVSFTEPVPARAVGEIAHLPGVTQAEGSRTAPVLLRAGYRTYRTSISGVPANASLRRPIDDQIRPLTVPPEGLLMSRRLGDRLGVRPGDDVEIDVLEGSRGHRQARVAALVNDQVGLNAYMDSRALSRLLREDRTVTAVALSMDRSRADELYNFLKQLPKVETVSIKALTLRAFRETTGLLILIMALILSAFALTITIGVVYNAARIALHERAWDLASLRVLGFTRREVSMLLLGESVAEIVVAVPLGLLAGRWLVRLIVDLHETEMFKVPAVIEPRSYVIAALSVIAAATISGFIVRRRIDRLDLVGVLKARD